MPGKKPDPVDIHVGSRIKMQRRIMEMSQTELADAVGLTFQQIQKYENRKNRVSSSRLQQFAAILNVPAPFFFDDAPSPKMKMRKDDEPDYQRELANTYGGLDLAKAFSAISEDLKEGLRESAAPHPRRKRGGRMRSATCSLTLRLMLRPILA